jgi:hypothetical protein
MHGVAGAKSFDGKPSERTAEREEGLEDRE